MLGSTKTNLPLLTLTSWVWCHLHLVWNFFQWGFFLFFLDHLFSTSPVINTLLDQANFGGKGVGDWENSSKTHISWNNAGEFNIYMPMQRDTDTHSLPGAKVTRRHCAKNFHFSYCHWIFTISCFDDDISSSHWLSWDVHCSMNCPWAVWKRSKS